MATIAILFGCFLLCVFAPMRFDHSETSRRFGRVEVWLPALLIGLCLIWVAFWTARPEMPQAHAQTSGASQQRENLSSAAAEDLPDDAEPTRDRASRDDIFTVIVLDSQGVPVAGAQVSVSEPQPAVREHSAQLDAIGIEVQRLHTTTNSEGVATFSIPGWAAANPASSIVVRKSGFQPHSGEIEWAAVRAEVTLFPGLGLAGRAVLYDGRPPRDARAYLYAVGEDAQPVAMASPAVTELDPQGDFSLTGLTDCEYEVVVKCAGYCMHPMERRRFRPGGGLIKVTMLPVMGCRIQLISHDGMTMVLPHGTTKRIESSLSLDYTMDSTLAELYDLPLSAKAMLNSGELIAGIAMNAKPGQDFSASMAKIVLDAPSGCVTNTEFPCLVTGLEDAIANPHFFTIEPLAGWRVKHLQATSSYGWMDGGSVVLGVQSNTNTFHYHLQVGEVVRVIVPSVVDRAHVIYDGLSDRKLLGNVFGVQEGALVVVDTTPDRIMELFVRSKSGEPLASWMIGELRGTGSANANIVLRNVEVFGRNHFRLVNYPEGPYEIVVVAGKFRVSALFDGRRAEQSIVVGL